MCSESDEDTSEKSVDEESLRSTLEELTEVQFQFEVKAVRLSSSLCLYQGFSKSGLYSGSRPLFIFLVLRALIVWKGLNVWIYSFHKHVKFVILFVLGMVWN